VNIAFRADASYKIGSGHVMRSLVLADTLKARGCNILFISRLLDGHLVDLIRDRGFEIIILGVEPSIADNTTNTDWLGVSQQDDAKETIKNLKKRVIDIIFVDHYSLDILWEKLINPFIESIVVIDDLANRNHDCNFLIDQNFRNNNFNSYEGLVPDNCKTLLGLQYAILSPEYRELSNTISARTGSINRVLVYFGGTDWQNMTYLAIEVLSQREFSFLEVDVVIGSNYPFLLDLEKLISKRPNTNLYQSLPSLAKLMSVADIAIGAGGTTLWERMSMGLPAIVVSLADNQILSCESLQKENLIDYLGSYKDLSNDILSTCLRERICSPEDNYKLSMRISEYVDGCGALKIAQAMEL
jgi:UDP-2,4-diacetamido-2,4,6-trideoxy-beta-L-altropyranose hydrolase